MSLQQQIFHFHKTGLQRHCQQDKNRQQGKSANYYVPVMEWLDIKKNMLITLTRPL